MEQELSPIERIAIKWGDKFDAAVTSGEFPNVKFIIMDAINEATRDLTGVLKKIAFLSTDPPAAMGSGPESLAYHYKQCAFQAIGIAARALAKLEAK